MPYCTTSQNITRTKYLGIFFQKNKHILQSPLVSQSLSQSLCPLEFKDARKLLIIDNDDDDDNDADDDDDDDQWAAGKFELGASGVI